MKSIKKISFFLLIFILGLFFSSSTIHATDPSNLPIGSSCLQLTSALCATDKCESSSVGSSFCVCNTGQHCKDKYGQIAPDEVWTCNPGNEQSLGLSFCDSNKREAQMPVTPEQAAAGVPITSSNTSGTISSSTDDSTLKPPTINVPIPGLEQFTEIEAAPGEEVSVPYMAQYIVGIYKYGLVIASILAAMMLMIGGIMYMTGGMNPSLINQSKTIIFGAISGLILLLCSYLILNIINPNLVKLSSLEVQTIEAVEMPMDIHYPEGPPEEDGTERTFAPGDIQPWTPVGPATAGFQGVTNMTYSPVKNQSCLKSNFFGGNLEVGDDISAYITRVPILGTNEFIQRSTPNIPVQLTSSDDGWSRYRRAKESVEDGGNGFVAAVHSGSVAGWNRVTQELQASTDPEVQGYMQYLYDVGAGKAPTLTGDFYPNMISTNTGCGAGLRRRECSSGNPGRMRTPFSDPHVVGLAVDIMSKSNWDIRVPGTRSGRDINNSRYCGSYQRTINKMKNGDYGDFFKSDPYKMYDRVQARIDSCLANEYAFWSVPDEWINIFTRNNFYFAGWAWGDPKRADGMHHEFYGNCFQLRGRQVE